MHSSSLLQIIRHHTCVHSSATLRFLPGDNRWKGVMIRYLLPHGKVPSNLQCNPGSKDAGHSLFQLGQDLSNVCLRRKADHNVQLLQLHVNGVVVLDKEHLHFVLQDVGSVRQGDVQQRTVRSCTKDANETYKATCCTHSV